MRERVCWAWGREKAWGRYVVQRESEGGDGNGRERRVWNVGMRRVVREREETEIAELESERERQSEVRETKKREGERKDRERGTRGEEGGHGLQT